MVRFVQPLIADRVMFPPVDPIDPEVGEDEEPANILRYRSLAKEFHAYQIIEKKKYGHP